MVPPFPFFWMSYSFIYSKGEKRMKKKKKEQIKQERERPLAVKIYY